MTFTDHVARHTERMKAFEMARTSILSPSIMFDPADGTWLLLGVEDGPKDRTYKGCRMDVSSLDEVLACFAVYPGSYVGELAGVELRRLEAEGVIVRGKR